MAHLQLVKIHLISFKSAAFFLRLPVDYLPVTFSYSPDKLEDTLWCSLCDTLEDLEWKPDTAEKPDLSSNQPTPFLEETHEAGLTHWTG